MSYYQQNTIIGNYITCLIENGKIYQVDYINNTKIEIGVTNDTYNETTKLLEEYYNKCVEAGIVKKELTQEELLKQQKEMIDKQNDIIEKLMKKLDVKEVVENGYNGNDKELDKGKSANNAKSTASNAIKK